MSVPTEIDFALIKIGDGGGTETFAVACGIENVSLQRVANTEDRYVRDCAAPGAVPVRKVKVTGKALTITGDGMSDKAHIGIFGDALGEVKNYEIEAYADDGTDAGDLLGTFSGAFMMDAANISAPRNGTSTAEITLKNHGDWTWTAEA